MDQPDSRLTTSDVQLPRLPLPDDAPTPPAGVRSVRIRSERTTIWLAPRRWSGFRFVMITLVAVAIVLLLFFLLREDQPGEVAARELGTIEDRATDASIARPQGREGTGPLSPHSSQMAIWRPSWVV